MVIEEADIEYSEGSGELEEDAPWEAEDFDEDGDFDVEVEEKEPTKPVKMRRRSLGSKPEPEVIKLPPLTVSAIPVYRVKEVRSRTVVGNGGLGIGMMELGLGKPNPKRIMHSIDESPEGEDDEKDDKDPAEEEHNRKSEVLPQFGTASAE